MKPTGDLSAYARSKFLLRGGVGRVGGRLEGGRCLK